MANEVWQQVGKSMQNGDWVERLERARIGRVAAEHCGCFRPPHEASGTVGSCLQLLKMNGFNR